jgi:hypothetical protein
MSFFYHQRMQSICNLDLIIFKKLLNEHLFFFLTPSKKVYKPFCPSTFQTKRITKLYCSDLKIEENVIYFFKNPINFI